MITHSRETCQPTNVMRWKSGVFSMVYLNSGEKVRQGPQINPLAHCCWFTNPYKHHYIGPLLLVHKHHTTYWPWLALIVAVPLVFLTTHEVHGQAVKKPAAKWGRLVRACGFLGPGSRLCTGIQPYSTIFNHNYADVCPHSLWNFVNIIEYCPSLLVLGKDTSFFWTKCCLLPWFYPHGWFISCFF